MGLGASSLALGYMEGERKIDTPKGGRLDSTNEIIDKEDYFHDNSKEEKGDNANHVVDTDKVRDENENLRKSKNQNPRHNKMSSASDKDDVMSKRDISSSYKGGEESILEEAIDKTADSEVYDDLATETAHECVVILGDKDFDLLHRVTRIEAKMSAMEEEKVFADLGSVK